MHDALPGIAVSADWGQLPPSKALCGDVCMLLCQAPAPDWAPISLLACPVQLTPLRCRRCLPRCTLRAGRAS